MQQFYAQLTFQSVLWIDFHSCILFEPTVNIYGVLKDPFITDYVVYRMFRKVRYISFDEYKNLHLFLEF